MLREIRNFEKLYRITRQSGSRHYVVTDSIEALARYVVLKEKQGYLISSIAEMQTDGSTPRISIRSTPEYKKAKKEIMTFEEFQRTAVYMQADTVEAFDKEGRELELDWLKKYSGDYIVVEYRYINLTLDIVVDEAKEDKIC